MNALDAAIYSRLAASTALVAFLGGTAIYSLQAPDGAATPYVEFGIQGGGDENFNATRMKNQLVRIKCVSGGDGQTKATAGSADAFVDAAMLSAPLTISGWGNHFWIAREVDIEFTEVDEAKRTFYHVGGLYRLRYNEV